MSLLRRRMMMQQNEAPLYPFKNERADFGYPFFLEIKDGNKIKAKTRRNSIIDITHMKEAFNQLSLWFALNKGDRCRLILRNVNIVGRSTVDANFRLTENMSSVFMVNLNKGDVDKEVVIEERQEISCFFFYSSEMSEVEFEVEFYVNGVRYI